MTKAFLLGAGLGTRLQPLTNLLPKPLVPLFHRPLVEWAMHACRRAGISDFAINTHHLPDTWAEVDTGQWLGPLTPSPHCGENQLQAQLGHWHDLPVHLFHEPILLETGGGIRNLCQWIGSDPILVHNGDIYADLNLTGLIASHESSGNLVTLAVRSDGDAPHIALDGDQVIDIRELLHRAPGTHQFTGIYCLSPALLELIPPNEKVSVIPAFLELAKSGKLGAVVLDEGDWFDLGDHPSYLAAHRKLKLADPIHPDASIATDATIEHSVIGPGATIGAGATVIDSVVWPNATVPANARIAGSVHT